jgi:hypothetical protein
MDHRDRLPSTTYRRPVPPYSSLRKRAQLAWLTWRITSTPRLLHVLAIICVLFFIYSRTSFFSETTVESQLPLPSSKSHEEIKVGAVPNNVIFVLDSKGQAAAWKPLLCRIASWSDTHVHVLISGTRRGAREDEIGSIIHSSKNSCSVNLYDMRIDDGKLYSWSEENKVDVLLQTSSAVTRVLKNMNSSVIFITKDEENYVMRGVAAALNAYNEVTAIAIPLPDLEHSLWIGDLSFNILQRKYIERQ